MSQKRADHKSWYSEIDWKLEFSRDRMIRRVIAHEIDHQLGIRKHHHNYTTVQADCAMNIIQPVEICNASDVLELKTVFNRSEFPLCVCQYCNSKLCSRQTFETQ